MIRNFLLVFLMILSTFSFAQKKDSAKIQNERFAFAYKKLYVPAVLMTVGILVENRREQTLQETTTADTNDLLAFGNHLDDYLQFAPTAAVYGLELAGMNPRTDWQNRTAILIKGQALNLGLVYVLKKSLKKTRPDGTGYSFPSGHTANAFAGATMLAIEYGEEYRWVPYVSYGVATGVGLMRMSNEKHYLSDVLFGAGLGILSMKVAYWTHQYQWNKTKSETDPYASIYRAFY